MLARLVVLLLVACAAHPAPVAEPGAGAARTGVIQGIVKGNTGVGLGGVTVIVMSPVLPQAQTAITDAHGFYKLELLPPGDYVMTFYYGELAVERSGVHVWPGPITPVYQQLDHAPIVPPPPDPTIDPTGTDGSSSPGAIAGIVKDAHTDDGIESVTVIVTSFELGHAETAITDIHGFYKIALPPGDYDMTFYYADLTVERRNIRVVAGKTTPAFQKLNLSRAPSLERIPPARRLPPVCSYTQTCGRPS